MHFLFPGAKIWPIYARAIVESRAGIPTRVRYWLGKQTRSKRAVIVTATFNLNKTSDAPRLFPAPVDNMIKALPDSEYLRVGFLPSVYKDNNNNLAVGIVYDIRSIKYAVSK